MNTLHATADVFDELMIDPDDTSVGFTIWRSGHLTLELHVHKDDTEEVKATRRRLKRLFGPLKADGEPPYVTLRGSLEVGEVAVTLVVYGAFECKVTGHETHTVPAQPAVPERIEQRPLYSCEAVVTESG